MPLLYLPQAARGSISQEELSPEQRQALLGEDEAHQIAEYEEAFKRIKEATGVSDTQVLYIFRFRIMCQSYHLGLAARSIQNKSE